MLSRTSSPSSIRHRGRRADPLDQTILSPAGIQIVRGVRRTRLIEKVIQGNLEIVRRETVIAYPGSPVAVRLPQVELRLIDP